MIVIVCLRSICGTRRVGATVASSGITLLSSALCVDQSNSGLSAIAQTPLPLLFILALPL